MNRSNLEHAVFGLVFQMIVWIVSGDLLAGAAFGSAFFLGREHAQREYKIGDPSKLVGYEAFDFMRWTRDEVMDLVCPVVSTFTFYLLVTL